MTTVSKINQVRRDIIAAFEKNPDVMLKAVTDEPQATLNQFTRSYGIQLLAEEEVPVITYLRIRLKQGCNLDSLLNESISLHHSSSASVRATLFSHVARPQQTVTAKTNDESGLVIK